MSPQGDWVDHVAAYMGAPGPALRLLVTLLMAFPMAVIHRQFLHGKYFTMQHIFFIICGSYLGYFNYGMQLMHAYVCILLQYGVLYFSRGSLFSVVFSFAFQMMYLLTEYYMTESETYDLKWTIPHCVLTLRLIGQAFDVFDGQRNDNELSKDQKLQALKRFPTLLESAGHVFYPGSFLIGPQYAMRRYLDFVEGKFAENNAAPPSFYAGFKRMLLGLFYVGVFQVGSSYVNPYFLMSPTFKGFNFIQRMLVIGIFGKLTLYKYVSFWLVAEGSCIYGGISHNGKNSDGEIQWNGCENVDIVLFEKSYKFGHMINSFNKCTNTWIAQNVYKRLKFANNRHVSQAGALVFLAVWHGLHSGYYMCFFMEYLIMNAEKQFDSILAKSYILNKWHNSAIGFWIDAVVFKIFVMCYFGFCMVPFTLLKYRNWGPVYNDLYWSGLVVFGLFPAYAPALKWLIKLSQPRRSNPPEEKGPADQKSASSLANGLKAD